MTTKLDKAIKREIEYQGVPFTVTLSPDGLKIVEKGKRKGQELTWDALMSGSAALAGGLRDSIAVTRDETAEG